MNKNKFLTCLPVISDIIKQHRQKQNSELENIKLEIEKLVKQYNRESNLKYAIEMKQYVNTKNTQNKIKKVIAQIKNAQTSRNVNRAQQINCAQKAYENLKSTLIFQHVAFQKIYGRKRRKTNI
uniref:Uncharacterized protein n=1 Tax=viral metagenome TaxID=1070528 RepID=A0A6C0FDU8_9ZZZZ|tara:strand:- start:7934 stop:8305 length:372 start_codon:yes stop_codon:yes gene_type:complete